MATNTSGVEWGSIVKPILAASYGSFNKNDITELAKAIILRYVHLSQIYNKIVHLPLIIKVNSEFCYVILF